MKTNDKAYVVAISRAISEEDTAPNPWQYYVISPSGRYGSTDEDERRGTRMELGKAKELVEALGKVDGFRAAYFVASEFTK